ncbi:phage tail tape measure protein [Cereibacter azotoformans]|uniref:phage tail tape measure protein n=1 Tax=Cereibacter azotoformans TaxID=43057 RepID=UPI003B2193C5
MANQRLNATITIGAAVNASLGKAVGTVKSALGSIGAGGVPGMQARIGSAIERNNAALADARMGIADAVGSYYALKGALGAPIRAAADFETVLEDIGQKAEIPQEKLGELGEQIKRIARDTNQGAAEIGAAVDALAGRGASTEIALAAANPIGKAATAYRASTDDLAAAAWSAVDNLKVPADQIETALDAMAQAGKAGAFELRDMATYFPSLGAAYQGLGQSGTGAVADLAAALQVVRKGTGDASTAATNLSNVLQKIYAPGTVKKFRAAGVDVFAEMEAAAQRGLTPIEAIAELTEKTLGGDLSKMGDLFEDAQVQAGMRSLIQGMEEYRRIRAEAMGSSGVLEEDYQRRIKTAAGATKRWNASLELLSITFGSALLPALNDVLDAVIPVIGKTGEFIEANPRLVSGLALATGGLIAFKGALAAIKFLGLVGKGGALDLLAFGLNTVGRAGARLGGAAKGAIALQTALGAMSGGPALSGLAKFGIGLRAAVMAVPGISALGTGIAAIGGAVATISAPVWGLFAAVAVAVASAGLMIWKYWDRISSVFSGVAARIGEELAPAFEAVRPALEWFAPIGDTIAAAWQKVGAAIGAAVGWIKGLFSREVLTEDQKAEMERAGYDAADRLISGFKALPGQMLALGGQIIQSLWDGAGSVFEQLVAWVVGPETAGRLIGGFKALPGQMLTLGAEIIQSLWDGMKSVFDGLVSWVGERTSAMMQPIRDARSWVGSWFGGGEGESGSGGEGDSGSAPSVARRAVGGYFSKGPVMVGEHGPELRFEDRAGYIATARQTAQLMGGGGGVTVGDIHIHAQPGQDPRAIADEVMRIISSRARGALYDGAMA